MRTSEKPDAVLRREVARIAWQSHRERFVLTARRILRESDVETSTTPEDVACEAMRRFLEGKIGCRGWEDFRSGRTRLRAIAGEVAAVLRGAIRYIALREFEQAIRATKREVDVLPGKDTENPEYRAVVQAERSRVESLLEGLTMRQREVFLLRMEGLPGKDIASRLGIAPATVKVHLREARRRLRNRVG